MVSLAWAIPFSAESEENHTHFSSHSGFIGLIPFANKSEVGSRSMSVTELAQSLKAEKPDRHLPKSADIVKVLMTNTICQTQK